MGVLKCELSTLQRGIGVFAKAKIYGGTVGEPAPHGFRLNANPAPFGAVVRILYYDDKKREDTASGVLAVACGNPKRPWRCGTE